MRGETDKPKDNAARPRISAFQHFSVSAFSPTLLITAALLISLDAGIKYWRSSAPTSSVPVWSLDVAEEEWGNTAEIRRGVNGYGADRGTELNREGPNGEKLTVFYFEWDEIAPAPFLEMGRHTIEQCNVAAGFRLEELLPAREYQVAQGPILTVDSRRLRSPSGKPVFVFRISWIQGFGDWNLRNTESRLRRLGLSFTAQRGEGRVFQAAVMGAGSESAAWKYVSDEVLDKKSIAGLSS